MLSAITRRGIWCRPQHRHQFWLPQRRISRSSVAVTSRETSTMSSRTLTPRHPSRTMHG